MLPEYEPATSFNGGDLDCGNGLLLLIRKHIDPLKQGELLEIISTESSVEEDLPAWCRLTKNELVSVAREGKTLRFLVSKGAFHVNEDVNKNETAESFYKKNKPDTAVDPAAYLHQLPQEILPFSVMGIGSWPRPHWLLPYLHQWISGQTSKEEFDSIADDAIRLCVKAQDEAGADVLTDGELRRDSYASFIGTKLENCQLIPLVDLLPLVDEPEKFKAQLEQLDVPATEVRHPAVFGKIARKAPLVLNEVSFLRSLSEKPIKVSLPGPYLLARTMWMECISDKAYESREALAEDIVTVLREELVDLLEFGVEIIQFDEPVLTEVVFANDAGGRTFMCGALGEKKPPVEELEFASSLMNKVCKGFPVDRLALHICRGNWTRDESKALSGDYEALLSYLNQSPVKTLFLEHATNRAGTYEFIKSLSPKFDLALGFVNQKSEVLESVDDIVRQARSILELMPIAENRKLYLVPDCGFATFADSPIAVQKLAKEKLLVLHKASEILRCKI